jgi:hypothetical protein
MVYKIETFKVPNLYKETPEEIAILEKTIEDAIEKKVKNGYTLVSLSTGDNFAIALFSK